VISVLLTGVVQAQIFKFESENGGILYADTECKGSGKQSELAIEKFDEKKIIKSDKHQGCFHQWWIRAGP
jgi:hypothetical protein